MKKIIVTILSIMLLLGTVSVCTGCGGGKTTETVTTGSSGVLED